MKIAHLGLVAVSLSERDAMRTVALRLPVRWDKWRTRSLERRCCVGLSRTLLTIVPAQAELTNGVAEEWGLSNGVRLDWELTNGRKLGGGGQRTNCELRPTNGVRQDWELTNGVRQDWELTNGMRQDGEVSNVV